MSLVFFDFDKTITKIDTLLPFALFVTRKRGKIRGFIHFLNSLVSLRLGTYSNTQLKNHFAFWFLKGEREKAILHFAEQFFEQYINRIIDLNTLVLLRHHIQREDKICILSANFSFFLIPLKQLWHPTNIIATEAEIRDGKFTGRIRGVSCHGQEKLQRVIKNYGENSVKRATAYGDSKADLFLLNYVKTGVLIQREEIFLKKLMFHLKFFLDICSGTDEVRS